MFSPLAHPACAGVNHTNMGDPALASAIDSA
jgi:hypothetical protein